MEEQKLPENTFLCAMTLDALQVVDTKGQPVIPYSKLRVSNGRYKIIVTLKNMTTSGNIPWFFSDVVGEWPLCHTVYYIEACKHDGSLVKIPVDRYTGMLGMKAVNA